MKVINSLENRGILLKETTRKVTSHEGGFLNFYRPIMTAGLPFMKNVPTPLAKNVLLPFALSVLLFPDSNRYSYWNKNYGLVTTSLIISNEEIEDVVKIFESPKESRFLIQGISVITANKTKEKMADFSQCY